MRNQLLLIVQLALSAMLMWTCFCRAIKTDEDTHREVRWAIWFEGLAAGIVFGAPLLPVLMVPGGSRWSPTWQAWSTPWEVWLVLLFAVTLVQLVTAKYWAKGQAPIQFQKPSDGLRGVAFAALLLMVGLASFAPAAHTAPSKEPGSVQPGEWRQVEGDVVYLPPEAELRCTNPNGCIAFTTEGLRELLRDAGGTCGHIPPLPGLPGKGT